MNFLAFDSFFFGAFRDAFTPLCPGQLITCPSCHPAQFWSSSYTTTFRSRGPGPSSQIGWRFRMGVPVTIGVRDRVSGTVRMRVIHGADVATIGVNGRVGFNGSTRLESTHFNPPPGSFLDLLTLRSVFRQFRRSPVKQSKDYLPSPGPERFHNNMDGGGRP